VLDALDPDGQDAAACAVQGLPPSSDTDALPGASRDESQGLVAPLINLSDPTIAAPWVGRIVSNERLDGCFPRGRLDFRR
jgi:hypothetical protein